MVSIITLTTDFGTEDPYVGTMKGVMLGISPAARLVDLTHGVQPQQVLQASFLLSTAYSHFPEGTIHVVVVDPGVGTSRRALAVQAGGYYFVAPDNGLLSHVLFALGLEAEGHPQEPVPSLLRPGMRAVSLTNAKFWRHPVSSTFHGRDIFAPAAGHLSRGVKLEELGTEISSILLYPLARPRVESGAVDGTVVHVDQFGNLVTDIRGTELPAGDVVIHVARRAIAGVSFSYADAERAGHDLVAIVGSAGFLEISAPNASAASRLGIGLGEHVRVVVS